MTRGRKENINQASIKNESTRLGFYTEKSSPMDSISMYKNQINWTRFVCIKTESNVLVFYRLKSSPFNSIFMHTW